MDPTSLTQNGTADAGCTDPPSTLAAPHAISLSKMVGAFKGRRFNVGNLRDVARATDLDTAGEDWELLKMTSGTEFDEMTAKTLREVGATAVRFFGLSDTAVWKVLPPSRLRWALATEADAALWATGVQTNVLRAGAFLLEEIPLGGRDDPDGAKALAEAVKAKKQSIAVYPSTRDGFERQFVLSETAGPPADPK